MMKCIFMTGTAREKSIRYLLEIGVNITHIITPRLSRANRRFTNVVLTAAEFGVPLTTVTKESVDSVIGALDYEVLISCGFSYIIKKSVIDKAIFAINSHPTLLPKYRGYRSGPFILINGETESGVTIHFLTEEMDKGDIILQQKFIVSKFDTTKSVYHKAVEIEGPLLYRALLSIFDGSFQRRQQNESEASEFHLIRTPKDSLIDWNKSLKELYNEIRACDSVDYPAYFMVDDQKVFIKLWRDTNFKENEYQI